MRTAGSSDESIATARASAYWPGLLRLAHTLAYDAAVLGDSRPPDGVEQPVLVLTGGGDPFFESAADALAHALPNAERETLPAQGHVADPKALAPALERFYRPRT
jgi:hypothetical protein